VKAMTRVAGRYEVVRPLGHGAMATVDLAHDVELDRPVALKRLAENFARDDGLRRRFVREARLAARLAHPHVVRVFDVGEDDGRPFIAMEYVEGETLADLVARRGPLPAAEAARLGMHMCAGLAAAHAAGLVHRDVKPQNLLLGTDGALKLGDFGIAAGHEGTRLTVAGTVLGTAGYLAPEQARGEQVTAAADIYAVGAVLYELLTGGPARSAGSLAELGADDGYRPPDLAGPCPGSSGCAGHRGYGVPLRRARGQAALRGSACAAARSRRVGGRHPVAARRSRSASNRDPRRPAGAAPAPLGGYRGSRRRSGGGAGDRRRADEWRRRRVTRRGLETARSRPARTRLERRPAGAESRLLAP
jgi:tRNA A-37 threonylcarbamoyl transferase component Bud32